MINVGGAKLGGASMSTFDHPGRYTYRIAENEEASPGPPYHVAHGAPEGSSAATSARRIAGLVDGQPVEQQALQFARTPPTPETLIPKFPWPREISHRGRRGNSRPPLDGDPGLVGDPNGFRPTTRIVETS
jgi:hypothetical protein